MRRWPIVERTITIDNTLSLLNMPTVLFFYLLNLFDVSRYKIKWGILSVKIIKGELWRSHGYIASYEMGVLLRLVRIYLNGFWIIIKIQLFEIQVSTSITGKKKNHGKYRRFVSSVVRKESNITVICEVIYQKRVRVLHQGFQTPRNRWKHEAAGRVLLLFRGVWNPWWNTKHEFLV